MEDKEVYTILALVAVVTLVLSCVLGAVAGGVAGLLVGRRQAQAVVGRTLERDLDTMPRFQQEFPVPEREERETWPFEGRQWGLGGAVIQDVIPDSPADKAGLQEGDILTAIDRVPIDANHPLRETIEQYEPGDWVNLQVLRATEEDEIELRLGANPDNPDQAYLGIYYMTIPTPDFEVPSE